MSDTIEAFIKELLEEEAAHQAQVELRRNELAEYFRCAPSQINYVLSTRFTPDHGYIIESRRGGGGYIRIIRVAMCDEGEQLMHLVNERVGNAVTEAESAAIVSGLEAQGVIDTGEARLMLAATSSAAIALPLNIKDTLRAAILRTMLLALARREQKE